MLIIISAARSWSILQLRSLLATCYNNMSALSDFVASKYETESYCLDSRYLLATVAKLEANDALYGTILYHYSKLTSDMCLWVLAKIQVWTLLKIQYLFFCKF